MLSLERPIHGDFQEMDVQRARQLIKDKEETLLAIYRMDNGSSFNARVQHAFAWLGWSACVRHLCGLTHTNA